MHGSCPHRRRLVDAVVDVQPFGRRVRNLVPGNPRQRDVHVVVPVPVRWHGLISLVRLGIGDVKEPGLVSFFQYPGPQVLQRPELHLGIIQKLVVRLAQTADGKLLDRCAFAVNGAPGPGDRPVESRGIHGRW